MTAYLGDEQKKGGSCKPPFFIGIDCVNDLSYVKCLNIN